MERWKVHDPSLRLGDSEEDAIVLSDDEEGEVEEAPPSSGDSYHPVPLAERIGPVTTGQRAVRSSPGYQEARKQRRAEKSKAEEYEPVRGTRAARKRYSSALIDHFAETERQVEQALPFLSSSQECLADRLADARQDSEKENRNVGEGSSHGVLRRIPTPEVPSYASSPSPIPIPAPKKKPSLEKVTEDLKNVFKEERQRFLDGYGPPLWLEHQLERNSPEPRVERSGVGYVSVSDVDEFLSSVGV